MELAAKQFFEMKRALQTPDADRYSLNGNLILECFYIVDKENSDPDSNSGLSTSEAYNYFSSMLMSKFGRNVSRKDFGHLRRCILKVAFLMISVSKKQRVSEEGKKSRTGQYLSFDCAFNIG